MDLSACVREEPRNIGYVTTSNTYTVPDAGGYVYNTPTDAAISIGNTTTTNKIRPVTIEELNYGYIIRVGCHSFAIESSDTILSLLKQYMNDPQGTEDLWFKGELL